MARIKVELPAHFSFSTIIPIRITDLNYGRHVGNDSILSLIHEVRIQFLKHYGFEELNIGGVGLIMSDVGIEFKQESFYGDQLKASVAAGDFYKVGFDLYYKLERETEGKTVLVAAAKTGMVCFDYDKKKIAAVPDIMKEKLSAA